MSSYKLSAFPILILVLSFFASLCLAQIEFTHHAIANYSGAQSIYGADMDGDGDMDLVATGSGAQTIQWWENDGEQGFETHVIVQNFTGAQSAFALDVDGDGDIDVIGAASGVDDIIWCENDGEMNFETHVVNGNFDGACCVNGVDLDLDGDIDLVGAAADADDIAWWENDGNQDFEMHTIDDNFNGPKILDTEDVDGDGDIDVLAAGWHGHYISWFENDGDQDFTEHTIVTDYSGAKGVYAADLDDDGDTDVITCAYTADDVDWWENDGDENFTQHNLTGDFDNVWNVYADDIDLDGDMDVLAAARSTRAIYYWENDGEGDFTQRTVAENWNGAIYMHTADVDSDGDLDVFGAAYEGARIAWFESNLDPVPDASLEGTVSDGETGDLVEDAIVRAGAVRDTTDANGNYFIDDVLSGERTVIVTHTDYSRHVEEIEIEAGENTLDMELFPLSTVSGTVTDIDTGDPVEDAEIRFGNDETTTDENGDWEVPPQEQGERLVVISADHYYIFSEQVEVEPGENVFEFELIPLATITGTITDSETEAAVEDAEIVFGDFVYTAVSDENGDYSIEDVEAGEYPVTITTDGYFEFTDDIEVEERENEIDFSIDILSGDLTGVVSDEITEELLFEATITVIDPETGDIYREVQTDEDGVYTAEALHDGVRYLVFAELEGYARSDTEEVLIRWNQDNEQDIELTPIFERGIAQLQTEQELETWVSTTGIVTQGTNTTDTEHTNIYIQDDTNWGIQIWSDDAWDPENNINRGDEINVTGYLIEVEEITRITSFELEVTGNNNPLPEPLEEYTGDMARLEQREGTWAQIGGMIDQDPPDEGSYSLIVDDGTGQCQIRIIETTSIDLTELIADDWARFTGVISLSRQGVRIIPNIQEDVEQIHIYPPTDLYADVEWVDDTYESFAVTLFWSHDHLDGWIEFIIYRDEEEITRTQQNTWIDTITIDYEREELVWIYEVSASYDEGETETAGPIEVVVPPNPGFIIERPFSGIPTKWALEAVYPNPFNPELSIIIGLPFKSELDVRIYSILGKQVAELANGNYSPGYKHFAFDASELSSGIYFIHTSVPGKMNEVRKVVLMR